MLNRNVSLFFACVDSSPYPPNYPCPMPCPKNVHTGPLIGSKTSKGPGQTNTHLVAAHNDRGDTSNTTTSSSSLKTSASADATSCKVTDTVHTTTTAAAAVATATPTIFVKPEFDDNAERHPHLHHHHHHHRIHENRLDQMHSGLPPSAAKGTCAGGIYRSDQNDHCDKVGFAPPYYPNYTLNPKVLEQPEQPVSPARGSTGLPGSPSLQSSASEQHGQPEPNDAPTTVAPPTMIGRRARVGKSMAREMMMQPHLSAPIKQDNGHTIINDENAGGINNIVGKDELSLKQAILANHENIPTTLIKEEDVKKEHVDEIELIPEKSESKQLDADQSAPTPNKRKFSDENCDAIENLEQNSLADVAPILKRQKLLKIRQNSMKLSSKCSYKSLIRPSRPKPYLCKSGRKKLYTKALYRLSHQANGGNDDKSAGHGDGARRTKIKKSRKKMSLLVQRRPPCSSSSEKTSSSEHLNLMIPRETDATMPANKTATDGKTASAGEKNSSIAAKKSSESHKKAHSSNANVEHPAKPSGKSHAKLKLNKKCNEATDATDSEILIAKTHTKTDPLPESKSKAKTGCKSKANKNLNTKLHSETIGLNNNNNCLLYDKNSCLGASESHHQIDAVDDVLLDGTTKTHKLSATMTTAPSRTTTAPASATTTMRAVTPTPPAKRSKSRGSKFSNKKRHRIRSVQEIPEAILPRRTIVSPRWSNGWNWEGEPFQGKVFLNVSNSRHFSVWFSSY